MVLYKSEATQKRKIQKKEKGFWCGTVYDYSTISAESQLVIEQETNDLIVGEVIRRVTPGYPMQARAGRVEGNVIVEVVISETGEVASIKSFSGPPALIEASTESAKKWRFTITTVKGSPVTALARIAYKYDLGLKKGPEANQVKRKAPDQ